jgi:hypothetical protein
MTLGRHLAYTGAAAAALLPFRSGAEILLFAAAGILIDADHYLLYVLRRRDMSVRGMFRYFDEFKTVEKTVPYFGLCLFHTVDVLFLVGILAWFFPLLRPVVAGMLFHHLLDIIDLHRKGVPFIRAFSLIEHFIRRRGKGYPYY